MYSLENKEYLYIELYNQLKDDIINNYKVGEKLPSIREVATLYNISKTTVENAYSQLYAEGYIQSRPRSGYYVSDIYFDVFKDSINSIDTSLTNKKYKIDFFPAALNSKDFPHKIWKRVSNRVLSNPLDFGSYSNGAGEIGLRDEITKYLKNSRGVNCSSNQVVITHGFADAMGLVAKLLKPIYNNFAIEEPGYHIPRRIFSEYGYKIEHISVNKGGIDLKELKSSSAEVLYLTPSHQYPLGETIALPNRLKILDHMKRVGGVIIEDDYDSELRYNHRPISSLQGLDDNDIVIYFGTFAKSLSPSIRVAYLVLPKFMLKLFKDSYDANFPRVSLQIQKTLELFMKEGYFDKQIRRIRIINKRKHNQLKSSISRYFKNYKIVTQGGGLAILIEPTLKFDWERLEFLSNCADIKIYLTNSVCNSDFKALRIGFGGFNLDDIDSSIKELSKCWNNSFIKI